MEFKNERIIFYLFSLELKVVVKVATEICETKILNFNYEIYLFYRMMQRKKKTLYTFKETVILILLHVLGKGQKGSFKEDFKGKYNL